MFNMTGKYKYGGLGNPEHKHVWGEPIGFDKTQFCECCGAWRKRMIKRQIIMATDEEYREADKQARIIVGKLFEDCANNAYAKGKKEGIQTERERIRKECKKREYCIEGEDDVGYITVINKEDLDIWDDE